ncbi:MAG: hypothetical protein ACHQWV_02040, partial [Nitrospirales bacterium]
MKYVFLTAHQVLGIAHKDEDPGLVLFEGREPDTRVVVTRQLDHHRAILDRQLALASMLSRGMIGQPLSLDFPENLAKEIDAVRHYGLYIEGIGTDNMRELGYHDRKMLHNFKYFTWVEQQGRSADE